jgi:hypothetical protein
MSSEDLSKSTIENIRDVILSRFKSRFTGAFIIAWIVWNWKIIYVTIFINKSEINSNKIDYIGRHYTDSCHLLWFPLIASLIAILLIPILNGLSDNWHELISGSIKRISMMISQRTPVDQAEFKKLVDRYKELETNYLTEIDRLKKEAKDDNDRMSGIIVDLNDELNSLKTEPNGNQRKSDKAKVRHSHIASDEDNSDTVKIVNTDTPENNKSYPSLQSVVMKNLPTNESEWIIVYSFFASNFGNSVFTRQSILDLYGITNRKTESRMKNFSAYLRTAVKSNSINPINDKGEFSLLGKGKERAIEIIQRTSSSIPTRVVKNKNDSSLSISSNKKSIKNTAKNVSQEEFDIAVKGKTLEQFFKENPPGESTNHRILLIAYYILKYEKQSCFSEEILITPTGF